ncbi:MAG: GNAT family N-acetyltransferase [Clostridia bacterium]
MKIRRYRAGDCAEMAELFFHTVHAVNAKDYSESQLDAWATGNVDIAQWNRSFLAHTTLVAETGDGIVGFGDMDDQGYLDRLYVHRDHQHSGIASALVKELERLALARGVSDFSTYASITARPFFEKCGYRVIRENTVLRAGVALTNYQMEKGPVK